ncbi:hypothetical protein B0H14DRAFT_377552 [Mycena olivaceomarginata]|nr:hypothetical protein B0H14DRAFT_377552 [Mycena olivaceomarginata]
MCFFFGCCFFHWLPFPPTLTHTVHSDANSAARQADADVPDRDSISSGHLLNSSDGALVQQIFSPGFLGTKNVELKMRITPARITVIIQCATYCLLLLFNILPSSIEQ